MSETGYPDNNPKTTQGLAKAPLHLVPPSVLANLSDAFAEGARKYGPYNWREKSISSSVYYAAVLRHLTAWWDGEDIDPDSQNGSHHLSNAQACLAMLQDAEGLGILNDDRPPPGPMPAELAERSNRTTAVAPASGPLEEQMAFQFEPDQPDQAPEPSVSSGLDGLLEHIRQFPYVYWHYPTGTDPTGCRQRAFYLKETAPTEAMWLHPENLFDGDGQRLPNILPRVCGSCGEAVLDIDPRNVSSRSLRDP